MHSAFRDTLRETLQQNHVAPRNDLETRLALMWTRHFSLEQIGVKDSFFDLGGSSLLAMKLLAEIREAFGVEIPPARMFEAQTIEAMAAMIRTQSGDSTAREAVPHGIVSLRSGGNGSPLFCVHPTGGDITCYRDLSRYLEAHGSVYGIQDIYSSHDAERSIEELAELYTELVRTLQARGPYQLCGWSMGGLLALEMASQLERQGEEVGWVGLIDTCSSMAALRQCLRMSITPGALGKIRFVAAGRRDRCVHGGTRDLFRRVQGQDRRRRRVGVFVCQPEQD